MGIVLSKARQRKSSKISGHGICSHRYENRVHSIDARNCRIKIQNKISFSTKFELYIFASTLYQKEKIARKSKQTKKVSKIRSKREPQFGPNLGQFSYSSVTPMSENVHIVFRVSFLTDWHTTQGIRH